MVLRRKGDYWYGDGPTDVWDYFVRWTRDTVEPVNHWKQAVCKCGHTGFEVDYDPEAGYLLRRCTVCGAEHEMFRKRARRKGAGPGVRTDPDLIHCVCGRYEFEVLGMTAPFQSDANSARWFYLGLRCVHCGCLGCYADWTPRYRDHQAWLAML